MPGEVQIGYWEDFHTIRENFHNFLGWLPKAGVESLFLEGPGGACGCGTWGHRPVVALAVAGVGLGDPRGLFQP